MNTIIVKLGIWGLVGIAILIFASFVFMGNALFIFDLPDKKVISFQCDQEGLRQIEMCRLDGNAVTNPSIHVSIHLGCNNYEQNDQREIFIVGNSSIQDNDVRINLLTFDTLRIEYKRGLKIFTKLDKVRFADSTLNLNVTYNELE